MGYFEDTMRKAGRSAKKNVGEWAEAADPDPRKSIPKSIEIAEDAGRAPQYEISGDTSKVMKTPTQVEANPAAAQQTIEKTQMNIDEGKLKADVKAYSPQQAAQDAEARQAQLNLLSQLQSQASGTAPSAAQMQLQQGREANIAAAQSMAASARGGYNPLMARQAAYSTADLNAKANREAALARIAEQNAAQQLLGSTAEQARAAETQQYGQRIQEATTVRGQDVNAAIQDAKNYLDAQVAQGQITSAEAQAQLQSATTVAVQNAQIAQQMADLRVRAQQGDRQAAADLEKLRAQTWSANLALDKQTKQGLVEGVGQVAKVAGPLIAAMSDERQKTDIASSSSDVQRFLDSLSSSQPNQSMAGSGNASMMSDGQRARLLEPQYDTSAATKSADWQAVLNSVGEATKRQPSGGQLVDNSSPFAAAVNSGQKKEGGGMMPDMATIMAMMNAGGEGASAMSDKRAKTDVKASNDAVKEFLSKVQAKSYEYKNPDMPGAAEGRRYGVMAQDLEKTPMGKSLVKDTPNGKMIDTVQGFGALLAAAGELNKRLVALEEQMKSGKKKEK